MTDTRASMMATLAEITSKPSTPGRLRGADNIRAALAKMDQPTQGRERTFLDRERAMRIADDPDRTDKERQRAKAILAGGPRLDDSDGRFLDSNPN